MTQEDSSALMADTHLLCWGYDDGLVQDGKDGTGPRSITFDGKFVYLTSSSLKNFLKLGTGKQGTIRGYVYANRELEPGWVVWTKGMLLFKEKASSSGGSSSSSSGSGAASSSSGVTPSGSATAAGSSGAAAGGGGSGSSTNASGSSTSVSGGGGGGGGTKEVNAEKFCTVIERDTLKVCTGLAIIIIGSSGGRGAGESNFREGYPHPLNGIPDIIKINYSVCVGT